MNRSVRGFMVTVSAVFTVAAGVGVATATPVAAAPASAPSTAHPTPPPNKPTRPTVDRVADPDAKLGKDWHASTDRIVTTAGDDSGLHVLVADRSTAYTWQTAATLTEPGIDTDQWVGQSCVTGSGSRAVVVYAPRQYANRPDIMAGGAYAAIVDLVTGTVTKLPDRVTMAYYSPGCGAGETVALSAFRGGDTAKASTDVDLIDTKTGKSVWKRNMTGQFTSLVPFGDGVAAAGSSFIAKIGKAGTPALLASTTGTPYRILADGTSGLAFQLPAGKAVSFNRLSGGTVTTVGTANSGAAKLRAGAGGHVFVVGSAVPSSVTAHLPASWKSVKASADSDISTTGALAIESASNGASAPDRIGGNGTDGAPDQVTMQARTADGQVLRFNINPSDAAGAMLSPALGGKTAVQPRDMVPMTAGDYSTDPTDPDRACAVPRNDPSLQAIQPSRQQVEWAADQAVQNLLHQADRTSTYRAQDLFPQYGTVRVPAQLLLGILAQESNLSQASWHVTPGSSGNPLTSAGFYGLNASDPNPLLIDWSSADCGYGVGQVTTGMLASDTNQPTGLTQQQQQAVAIDYASNIAASLQLIEHKWYELKDAGVLANGGDPTSIGNWFMAVWAYNSGFHPNTGGSGPWGLGWLNNPANPIYPADRQPFLTAALGPNDVTGFDNAKHPSDWSYPERIMGWTNTPDRVYDYQDETYVDAYTQAPWLDFTGHQPALTTFCVATVNNCDPSLPPHKSGDPNYLDQPAGPCQQDDLTLCWWHAPVSWPACGSVACGSEALTYPLSSPEPAAPANIHTPACSVTGLPSGAKIIDDMPVSTAYGPLGCAPSYTSGGSFALHFNSTDRFGTTIYPSKVDFHQLGAGFGGHLWFSHTYNVADDTAHQSPLEVRGTWTLNAPNGWTRLFVHIPDTGAMTHQADYVIHLPNGLTKHRSIPTAYEANTWVDLGVYDMTGTTNPTVELANFTQDGAGTADIAWDAIAYQRLAAKPANFVVGLGDSYSSGEGTGDYTHVSNQYGNSPGVLRDACRRSPNAAVRQVVLPGQTKSIGDLADSEDPSMSFAFGACSGARTFNMASTQEAWNPYNGDPAGGSYHERAQLDQGLLDENTTHVMLTIGGNDAGFTKIVTKCMEQACDSESSLTAKITNEVQPRISQIIAEIRERAPNALIVYVGYPHLFEDTTWLDSCTPGGPALIIICGILNPLNLSLSDSETDELNRVSDFLDNNVIASGNFGPKVLTVDTRSAFRGFTIAHWDDSGFLNTVAAPTFDATPESGESTIFDGNPVGMGSFHPTKAGAKYGFGWTVTDALAAYGTGGTDYHDPVAVWNMEEGTGTTLTDTNAVGTKHNATLTSGTTWVAGRIVGKKNPKFDGTATVAHTTGPVANTDQSYTVSAWAKLTNGATDRVVVGTSGTHQSSLLLEYNKAANRWQVRVPTADTASPSWQTISSTTAPVFNQWTHLAVTYQAETRQLSLYVNGVLQATLPNVTSWRSLGDLKIGGSGTAWFQGQISKVKVWNRPMSPAEIVVDGAPTLSAGYEFSDPPASTTAKDVSPYARDATLVGGSTAASINPEDHVVGTVSGSLKLNGTSGYAAYSGKPVIDTSMAYTVNAWVKIDSLNSESVDRPIAGQSGTNQSSFNLGYDHATNHWRVQIPTADTTTATVQTLRSVSTPVVAQWTHLVIVYDPFAQELRLYVNGLLDSAIAHVTSWNATGQFWLGHTGTTWWQGNIDAVRVYQGAMTDAQVHALP